MVGCALKAENASEPGTGRVLHSQDGGEVRSLESSSGFNCQPWHPGLNQLQIVGHNAHIT